MMVKRSFDVLDVGKDTGSAATWVTLVSECASHRTAPVLPDAFRQRLESKSFTNGSSDRPRVADLYRDAFDSRFGKQGELFPEGRRPTAHPNWASAFTEGEAQDEQNGISHR